MRRTSEKSESDSTDPEILLELDLLGDHAVHLWLEDHPLHAARMNRIHECMRERGDKRCTSVFTIGEVLTGLYKRDALEVASQVRDAFLSPQVELISFTPETADRYARIRAGIAGMDVNLFR